ncbi:MAG: hypothetical protein ABJC74_01125 [Gemmatimonadota bacterium]
MLGLTLGLTMGLVVSFVVRHRHALADSRYFSLSHSNVNQSPIRVLFVFTPEDCGGSLNIIDDLNLLQDNDHLTVLGLMGGTEASVPDWKAIVEINRIEFPVRLIDPAEMHDLMVRHSSDRTPLTIFFRSDSVLRIFLGNDPDKRHDWLASVGFPIIN